MPNSFSPFLQDLGLVELNKRSEFAYAARIRQLHRTLEFLRKYNPRQEPSPPVAPFWDELDNVRELFRWCSAQGEDNALVDIGCALAPYLWAHGLFEELYVDSDLVTPSARRLGRWEDLADMTLAAVLAHMDQYDPVSMARRLPTVSEAFTHMSAVPDELQETFMFTNAAMASLNDDPAAAALFDEDLAFTKKMGVGWRIAGSYYWLGLIAYRKGLWGEACGHFLSVIRVASESSDFRSMALGYAYLPEVKYRLGDREEAIRLSHMEAKRVVSEFGQRISKAQLDLGAAEISLGEAVRYLRECAEQSEHAVQNFEAVGRYGEATRGRGLFVFAKNALQLLEEQDISPVGPEQSSTDSS